MHNEAIGNAAGQHALCVFDWGCPTCGGKFTYLKYKSFFLVATEMVLQTRVDSGGTYWPSRYPKSLTGVPVGTPYRNLREKIQRDEYWKSRFFPDQIWGMLHFSSIVYEFKKKLNQNTIFCLVMSYNPVRTPRLLLVPIRQL